MLFVSDRALEDSTVAISLNGDYLKAYHRKISALLALQRHEAGMEELAKVLSLPGFVGSQAAKDFEELRIKLSWMGGTSEGRSAATSAIREAHGASGAAARAELVQVGLDRKLREEEVVEAVEGEEGTECERTRHERQVPAACLPTLPRTSAAIPQTRQEVRETLYTFLQPHPNCAENTYDFHRP